MTITNGQYLVRSGQTIRYSNHGQESLLVGEITENSRDYDVELFYGPSRLIFYRTIRLKKRAGTRSTQKGLEINSCTVTTQLRNSAVAGLR